MNTTTFSPKIYPRTKKPTKAKNDWNAGLYIANVKAYIKDHEAWTLILLIIFMIVGTVFYVGYQSRLDAGSGNPKVATIDSGVRVTT
jgi:hypothetical protein